MSRHRFLLTYDIADDRRRTRVHRALLDVGDWVQFSVFVADLSERELIQTRVKLRERINHDADQVLFIDLGPAERDPLERINALGRPYLCSERVQIV
jgi:CRISPR-associated protein Cas2